MRYPELALNILKEKGLRITKPRCLVIELLDEAEQPLSAYEIKDTLSRRGEQVDTVSIYRILDCLEENHLIHRVISSGKVRKCALDQEEACALEQHDHCHHFLVCEQCGQIEEVHCPGTEALVGALQNSTRFLIKSHRMEFSGLCPSCQPACIGI
ncbi:MAG: Fur family transcriptional regulator [Vampirovibrionales bacterium]|nr:Fur family transcriptional regulator [Vampirovibrionales bacterium]